jgi:uncharacterized protein YgbK (DUF1537 family)
MPKLKLGIIADDYTGASDAAGMLTERGVRTLLCTGLPKTRVKGFEALVIGLPTRSVSARKAYQEVYQAARFLRKLKVKKVQVKYCSTFDSTKKGNIGPSLDAAARALPVNGAIVCPALPVNGRTVYKGNLFVNGVPLSESPLRHHPLNPMTDSNIVRWLSYQTRKKVTLADIQAVRSGELVCDRRYLVTDTLNNADLNRIARASASMRLISGGSGITAAVAPVLFGKRRALSFRKRMTGIRPGMLVVAGSCSPATRAQNAMAVKKGFAPVYIDGRDILAGKMRPDSVIERVQMALEKKGKALLYASAGPDQVKKAQALGRRMGLSPAATGRRIGAFLARVTNRLARKKLFGRLVISGGETSGQVLDCLGWNHLEVGLPVEPGVPVCFPLAAPDTIVALKSGNFGSPDFYLKVAKFI